MLYHRKTIGGALFWLQTLVIGIFISITVFPESCATYGSGNHFHEAAYDAYLSGYVFLMVVRMLGKYYLYVPCVVCYKPSALSSLETAQ